MGDFVQLAHTWRGEDVSGWLMSDKLDGMRAFWDGGISRGVWAHEVEWANVTKDKRKYRSTGLWSRGAKVIFAPDWFLNELGTQFLDGELYIGPGCFQQTMSCVRKHEPVDSEWRKVRYHVFDSPGRFQGIGNPRSFEGYLQEQTQDPGFGIVVHCNQVVVQSLNQIYKSLDSVVSAGGEGVILRNPRSIWTPKRTKSLLKVKPVNDDCGIVTGYMAGRGKLEGLFGALVLDYKGKRLELSGFTEAERVMSTNINVRPGCSIINEECYSDQFPIGSVVTFKYRELSDGGIPKEARYFRRES